MATSQTELGEAENGDGAGDRAALIAYLRDVYPPEIVDRDAPNTSTEALRRSVARCEEQRLHYARLGLVDEGA